MSSRCPRPLGQPPDGATSEGSRPAGRRRAPASAVSCAKDAPVDDGTHSGPALDPCTAAGAPDGPGRARGSPAPLHARVRRSGRARAGAHRATPTCTRSPRGSCCASPSPSACSFARPAAPSPDIAPAPDTPPRWCSVAARHRIAAARSTEFRSRSRGSWPPVTPAVRPRSSAWGAGGPFRCRRRSGSCSPPCSTARCGSSTRSRRGGRRMSGPQLARPSCTARLDGPGTTRAGAARRRLVGPRPPADRRAGPRGRPRALTQATPFSTTLAHGPTAGGPTERTSMISSRLSLRAGACALAAGLALTLPALAGAHARVSPAVSLTKGQLQSTRLAVPTEKERRDHERGDADVPVRVRGRLVRAAAAGLADAGRSSSRARGTAPRSRRRP